MNNNNNTKSNTKSTKVSNNRGLRKLQTTKVPPTNTLVPPIPDSRRPMSESQ